MAPKGQAAARGVRTGWRLTEIIAAKTVLVTATATPKDVLEALAEARERGKPYTIGFHLAEASDSGARGKEVTVAGPTTTTAVVGATAERGGVPEEAAGKEAGIVDEGGEGGDESTPVVDNERGLVGGAEVRKAEGVDSSADGGLIGEGGDTPAAAAVAVDGPDGSGDGEATLMYEMYNEKFPIKVTYYYCTTILKRKTYRTTIMRWVSV